MPSLGRVVVHHQPVLDANDGEPVSIRSSARRSTGDFSIQKPQSKNMANKAGVNKFLSPFLKSIFKQAIRESYRSNSRVSQDT